MRNVDGVFLEALTTLLAIALHYYQMAARTSFVSRDIDSLNSDKSSKFFGSLGGAAV